MLNLTGRIISHMSKANYEELCKARKVLKKEISLSYTTHTLFGICIEVWGILLDIYSNTYYLFQIFMFKFHNHKLPCLFNNFVTRNHDVHSHFTRQANSFHVPVARTNLLYRSVRFKGVRIFNIFVEKRSIAPELLVHNVCLSCLIPMYTVLIIIHGYTFVNVI